MQKIFLLGVGAQKSGTTWLYNSLSNYSLEFQEGICKEYHVFDGLTTNPIKRTMLANELKYYANNNISLTNKKNHMALLWKSLFYENIDIYFDYFHLLSLKNPDKKLFADITPAYSSLSKQVFSTIKDKFESRGFLVKCIFLAREPLDRAWSASRYYFSKRFEKYNEGSDSSDHVKYFLNHYNKKKFLMRGRYDKTIANCYYIYKNNFKCIFYENLFTDKTVELLSKFLDLDNFHPNLNIKVNEGLHSENASAYDFLDPKIIKRFITEYRDVYHFMELNFPGKTRKYWTKYGKYYD